MKLHDFLLFLIVLRFELSGVECGRCLSLVRLGFCHLSYNSEYIR